MSGQTYVTSKSVRAKKASLRLNDLSLDLNDDQAPRKLLAELPIQNVNEKEQLRLRSEEQFPSWLYYLRFAPVASPNMQKIILNITSMVQAGIQFTSVWFWVKTTFASVVCCVNSQRCWRVGSDRSVTKLDSKASVDQGCKHAAEINSG